MRPLTVGLPRALLYHRYGTLWTVFLEELGCTVVVGPPTNARILEEGCRHAVDETCLSVKLFLGHVCAVADRCDVVLIPRLVTITRGEEACLKMAGVYDVVRNSLPDVRLEQYTVDVRNGRTEAAEMVRLARRLGAGRPEARRAYRTAAAAQERHLAEGAAAQRDMLARADGQPRVLVVGHAYNLADEFIGAPVLRILAEQGVVPVSSEHMDHLHAHSLAAGLSDRVYWTFNKELLGAIQYYRDSISGIVFVVTFPCGPDSLVAELCRHRVRDLPVATIVLDELQGLTGLRTRLESFADIVKARAAHA